MKNFPVKVDDKEYWISRSVAVAAFVFAKDKDEDFCILANKRGSGTPDFQGYWNCPCGYLDYNETGEQGAAREVLEETGVNVSDNLIFFGVDDDPRSNKQNVTLQYYTFVDIQPFVERKGGEDNEVSAVKWVKINTIDNYPWAFEHDHIIKKVLYNGCLRGMYLQNLDDKKGGYFKRLWNR